MPSPVPGAATPTPEHVYEGYRDDPAWLLARAEYLFPDTSNRDEKLFLRIEAARRMRDLEAAAEAQGRLR